VEEQPDFGAAALGRTVNVDTGRWNRMPDEKAISEAVNAIEKRGIRVIVVKGRAEALAQVREMIPPGSEVMNGSSATLDEIGFGGLLKGGKHGWKDLHLGILAEKDDKKRYDLRRKSVTAEYFLASVNAIAMTGELVACDASGSRVGAFPFAAKNLIIVSGANKIVPTLPEALDRLREYVFPLENARMKALYGVGSRLGKFVIIANEGSIGRTVLILVKESLGY